MEFKEYLKILKSNFSVVIYVMIFALVAAYTWSVRESQTYKATFLLNISRTETQRSADYRYDQFYRLQADEKFAETISLWLKSPGIVLEIFNKADMTTDGKTMKQLSKSFRAEKSSPQIITVSFGTKNEDEAKKTANAVSSVVSEKIENLNSEARDPDWFKADTSNLVVLKNSQDLRINLFLAAIAGLFLGTLAALGKHYLSS